MAGFVALDASQAAAVVFDSAFLSPGTIANYCMHLAAVMFVLLGRCQAGGRAKTVGAFGSFLT